MLSLWVVIFLLIATWWRREAPRPLFDPGAPPRAVTARGDLASDEKATIDIFKEASPSVVYITTREVARDIFSMNLFEIPRGTGSGIIFDTEGHIVTNFHVVAEGEKWLVTLADHSDWEASKVGEAPDKDIAVLQINAPASRLKPIAIGTSSDLQVGQKVFAIGDPFGLDQTLTTGIVSALGREINSLTGRAIHDVIQTDAAINPGNSGGPLLDSAGRLIGVNTQIASPSGASAGIGFAIPIDTVNRVATDLIRHGKVQRPVLGVVTWPDSVTRQLGVKGVLLRDVPMGSAADKAGLRGTVMTRSGRIKQVGDLILKVDDRPVKDQNSLLDALESHKIGDEVRVGFLRDDQEQSVSVRLQAPE
ncbi:MAG: trypsin-like peptidase domain-containing protein [Planctomycetes bacterium]|nr:trypsin-like peptidase domain-containing protein [Planctomycetota bacterium]MBI3835199.1 trypsin-like peptidase domain-containing protein [Planctomycetota bacterium]